MTLTADQILDVISREVPGPRHTAGIDVRRETLYGHPMSAPFLKVWCSCGWEGDRITVPNLKDPAAIPPEALEEAARSWRFHVTLSNRLYSVDRKLRRKAARGRQQEEE